MMGEYTIEKMVTDFAVCVYLKQERNSVLRHELYREALERLQTHGAKIVREIEVKAEHDSLVRHLQLYEQFNSDVLGPKDE
jgi:hypothetical protein